MEMVDHALYYAKLGMAVFPIIPMDKKPLTEHGFKDASKSVRQIRAWWKKWPNANIGIATGAKSGGIYVIDLDQDEDRGIDGYHSFEDWQREHERFPDSCMAITGRGGYHIYMKSKKRIRSRAGVLDGVDIRGEGGYVVAPPSVHKNGKTYTWEYGPDDMSFAMDDKLIEDFLQKTQKNLERPDGSFSVPEKIPKGQRNDVLFKYACSLQSRGVPDESIFPSVMAINEARCETSLDAEEVEGLVASALKYHKGPSLPDVVDPDHTAPILRHNAANGQVLQITQNVVEVLEHDPGLMGSICYNELAYAPFVRGKLPWDDNESRREWSNFDDANLCNYVEAQYGLTNRTKIAEALDIVTNRHRFNPVREVLEGLHAKWDGKEGHIESLLPDYMGVEKNIYSTECIRLFMLGAIMRAYYPGAKFDYMPVLVGKQGIGKSTFFRYLALDDKWYNDNFNTVEGDKAAEKLRGMWIVEMAELLATKKAKEIESIKAFLTSTADNYRQPYARRAEQRQRMCVFVGTTNSEFFLTDRTGNRRFLPLVAREDHIKKSLFENEDAVAEDFTQAWGEAMEIFQKNGKKVKLTLSKEAAQYAASEQERFTEEDTRVGIIQNWLDHTEHDRVCAGMIWMEALDNNSTPNRHDSNEILAIMANEIDGWIKMEDKAYCGKYGRTTCFEKWGQRDGDNFQKEENFVPLDENEDILFD